MMNRFLVFHKRFTVMKPLSNAAAGQPVLAFFPIVP